MYNKYILCTNIIYYLKPSVKCNKCKFVCISTFSNEILNRCYMSVKLYNKCF